MKKIYFVSLLSALILSSCSNKGSNLLPLNDRSNIGFITSASMLETSAEKITYSSSSSDVIERITHWADSKHPNRAELSCKSEERNCFRIQKALESFSIPVKHVPGNSNGINDITLVYEKLIARDCYEDLANMLPDAHGQVAYPSLGCAVERNILGMVSDHNQFISPKLSGLQDASRAVKALKEE